MLLIGILAALFASTMTVFSFGIGPVLSKYLIWIPGFTYFFVIYLNIQSEVLGVDVGSPRELWGVIVLVVWILLCYVAPISQIIGFASIFACMSELFFVICAGWGEIEINLWKMFLAAVAWAVVGGIIGFWRLKSGKNLMMEYFDGESKFVRIVGYFLSVIHVAFSLDFLIIVWGGIVLEER